MDKAKSALVSLLQLLLVFAAIGGVVAWKMWNPSDKKVLGEVRRLANEMCACKGPACADAVSREFAEKVEGTEVESRSDGLSSTYSEARMQIGYMNQCHELLQRGESFTVERDPDGEIRFIRPDSLKKPLIDLGNIGQ